jgi:hypothetical protein
MTDRSAGPGSASGCCALDATRTLAYSAAARCIYARSDPLTRKEHAPGNAASREAAVALDDREKHSPLVARYAAK